MDANGGAGFFQSIGINLTSGKKAIVFGCYNQSWAEFIGNCKLLTEPLSLVHVGRVKQHREVRFTAGTVKLIDFPIGLNIKTGADPGRKVSSRRGTHDSNPLWVDVPLRCSRADNPDRSLNILKGIFAFLGNPVMQNEGGDSVIIKPFGDRGHLRGDKIVIASSRT